MLLWMPLLANLIAEDEASDERLTALNAARRWLYDFRQPRSLSRQGSPWFAPACGEETMMETSNLAGGDNVGSSSDEKSSWPYAHSDDLALLWV